MIDKTILESIGVRVLWWQSVGNQIFIAKGTTTTEPEQIRNRKIRVFSPTHARFVKYCGGKPVMVSANKTPDAFAKSEIEMATGASSLVVNRQLWTVADTITRTLHAPIEFFLIVNEKVWQSLPEEHRDIITQAAREEEQQSRRNVAEIEAGLYTPVSPEGHDRPRADARPSGGLARLQRLHRRGVRFEQLRPRAAIDGGLRQAAHRPLLLRGTEDERHLQAPVTANAATAGRLRGLGPGARIRVVWRALAVHSVATRRGGAA